MKSKVTIFFFLAVVTLLETYFRLQDPANPSRPTVVLQRLDSQLTDILTYTQPFIKDISAVVVSGFHLVLRPFYGSFLVAGEIISDIFAHTPPNDLVLYLYFSTLSVLWVYCINEEWKKVSVKKEPTPVYDKMLYEGNVLKLQGEVQRLTLQNQRLGKELDRMCVLLKKEGVSGTGSI